MARKNRLTRTLTGKILLLIIASALAVGLYFGAKALLLPKFHEWRQAKILGEANKALEAKQYADALLLVRKGIQRYGDNTDFWTTGVAITEEMDSPEALRFSVLLERKDPSLENKYKVIEVATRYRSLGRAIEMLESLPQEASINKRTHELALEIYELLNDELKIKSHLRSLLSIDPNDNQRAFELELINLRNRNTPIDSEGIKKIQSLAAAIQKEDMGSAALLEHAIKLSASDLAATLISPLVSNPDLDPGHLGIVIDAQKKFNFPDYESNLQRYLSSIDDSILSTARVIRRLTRLREFEIAKNWIQELPEESKEHPRIQANLAMLSINQNNLQEAKSILIGANWERLESERLSMLALIYDMLSEQNARDDAWTQAIGAAGSNFDSLQALRKTANIRQWEAQLIETYRAIFTAFPDDKNSYKAIVAHDQKAGNIEGLLRTFSRKLEADPDDLVSKNNVAYLNLLSQRESQRALQLAKETYQTKPEMSHFAYTYALALVQNGQAEEAIRIIEKYDEELLLNDARRITLALAKADIGKHAEAAIQIKYLETSTLLPAEVDLLQQVKSKIVKANLYLRNEALIADLKARLTPIQKQIRLVPDESVLASIENFEDSKILFQHGLLPELQLSLADSTWGDHDFLRSAVLSVVQRNSGQIRQSTSNWEISLAEARKSDQKLSQLQDMASLHNLERELTEIAEIRFGRDPRNDELFFLLEERALATEDEALIKGIYERKSTAITADTAIIPHKLAYLLLVTEQNALKGMELLNQNPTPENEFKHLASLLVQIRSENFSQAFRDWDQLPPLEKLSDSARMVEAAIRLGNDEPSKAKLLFSEVNLANLRFYEHGFYQKVRQSLQES